jgi:NADPH-dependent ferric siderophore reductase
MSAAPQVTRVVHELRRRRLTVARVEKLAPGMRRVVLRGKELAGFTSLGFDDHVKLFFFNAGVTEMRDFTPRRFDAAAGELWIDFFLHDTGPAADWAARAVTGQSLEVGGPKRSAVISPDGIDEHVLIGDETALPAIARRLEELPAGSVARVFIEVANADAWGDFPLPAGHRVVWVARGTVAAKPAESLIAALDGAVFAPARRYFWVAMESQAARAVRRHLYDVRGIDKQWIKAAGYWQRAQPGAHEHIAEDE